MGMFCIEKQLYPEYIQFRYTHTAIVVLASYFYKVSISIDTRNENCILPPLLLSRHILLYILQFVLREISQYKNLMLLSSSIINWTDDAVAPFACKHFMNPVCYWRMASVKWSCKALFTIHLIQLEGKETKLNDSFIRTIISRLYFSEHRSSRTFASSTFRCITCTGKCSYH